jgi:biotin operon repressor
MPADPESLYARGLISNVQMDRLRETMTHWPEEPNLAQPYARKALDFFNGGLKGAGVDILPGWVDRIGAVFQNPDNQAAMGMAGVGRLPAGTIAGRSADELRAALEAKKSFGQIAKEWGVSRNTIAGGAARNGLTGQGKAASQWDNPQADQTLKQMSAAGDSYRTIGNELNTSRGAIAGRLDRLRKSSSGADIRGGTPSIPQLKSMSGPAEKINPAELKQYLDIFSAK